MGLLIVILTMAAVPSAGQTNTDSRSTDRSSNSNSTTAIPLDLRLRIAWGGGESAAWRGGISLSEGTFRNPRLLGDDPDLCSTIQFQPGRLTVQSARPSAYQALDISIVAPLTSRLHIEFSSGPREEGGQVIDVPLIDLVSGSVSRALDTAGNQLFLERAPGDGLRVEYVRDNLVFSPGEQWPVEIRPQLPQLPPSDRLRLQLRVVRSRSDHTLWKTERDVRANELGQYPSVGGIVVPIPQSEGAFELVVRLGSARNRNLFRTAKGGLERRIQFAVIDSRSVAAKTQREAWRESITFDPSQPQWWERLSRIPRWDPLAMNPMRLRGKGTAESETLDGRTVSRLEPGGWQTYPLPVARVGTPHILEVAYPAGEPQSLGISIVEPSLKNPEESSTLDTAAVVRETIWNSGERISRILFWPRTKVPRILLSNTDRQTVARFGRIRLLEGPSRLSPAIPPAKERGFRETFLRLDDPSFHKVLAARLATDNLSGRRLSDWETFLEGGERLVEFIRHSGYDGATLTCYVDGGSICPLPRLLPNSRFDTGVFSSSGQDPQPKDVVEMLLRMFDREGLRLNLSVRFNAPIPSLELQRLDAIHGVGIDPVDIHGQSNRASVAVVGTGCYYNALDRRVQSAIAETVQALSHSYGSHPSFAGISLDLGPDTFTQLLGQQWGYDGRTIAEFRREMADEISRSTSEPFELLQVISGVLRPIWLKWRADRMSNHYSEMARSIRETRPNASLILSLDRLVEGGAVRDACRPALPRRVNVSQALLGLGLDVLSLGLMDGIVVGRPHRYQPLADLNSQGTLEEFSTDSQWQTTLHNSLSPAGSIYQAAYGYAATVDGMSELFGSDTARTLPIQSLPDADQTRKLLSQALLSDDCLTLTIGGSHLSLQDNQPAKQWFGRYRRLPAARFAEHPRHAGHPVVVRTGSYLGKTYFYAVNDSPWRAGAKVQWLASADCGYVGFDSVEGENVANESIDLPASNWVIRGNIASLQLELEPYEMVAGVLTDPQATVQSVESDTSEEAISRIPEQLAIVTSRVTSLKNPTPLDRLTDPGFDLTTLSLSGWEWSHKPGVLIERDSETRYSGNSSLRIQSSQPVAWVRSQPIANPRTGRMSVQVMLRFGAGPPPPLRLALEGKHRGQPYYRFADVNSQAVDGVQSGSAHEEWSLFMLHIDDLPRVGLEEIRIRFDLMGQGVVWIDDVRLFDLAFTPNEQVELSRIIGLAEFQLRDGRPADCIHSLQTYWPRFLKSLAPASSPRVAKAAPSTPPAPPEQARPQSPPSFLQRMRRLLPRY